MVWHGCDHDKIFYRVIAYDSHCEDDKWSQCYQIFTVVITVLSNCFFFGGVIAQCHGLSVRKVGVSRVWFYWPQCNRNFEPNFAFEFPHRPCKVLVIVDVETIESLEAVPCSAIKHNFVDMHDCTDNYSIRERDETLTDELLWNPRTTLMTKLIVFIS